MKGWSIRLLRSGGWRCLLVLVACHQHANADGFLLKFVQPTLDRWMYPFNASPGCRASAPVFGTLSDDSGVDSRHGQFLIGFDFVAETVTNCSVTADLLSLLATNRGPANYLLRRVSLTVTVNRDRSFVYDPTSDAYTSYFPTNHPALTPDLDPGRPVELFGANYRGGWEAATFWENGPFGSSAPEQRNCFAAGYDTNGVLVDVSNNVGKTNVAFPPFEVYPFAVGTTELVAVGDFVPSGTKLSFNLNLEDPLVREYLQSGLDRGRLRFIVSSLHVSEFGGQPDWPDFYTRDNVVGTPPTLELEGTLVEPDDTDGDGLPDDWEEFYFGSLTHNGLEDSDGDGASNQSEFTAGTDPSEPASVLRIVSFSREADGTLVLRFPYPASHRPVIERSSDAINWSAVTNPALRFYFAPGLAEWRSEVAPDSVQLYRLRVL